MRLYFSGGEVPSHRKVLREIGEPNVALSFYGLTKRIKNVEAWHLDEKFPEDASILLDSGGYSVNNGTGDNLTQGELKALAERYEAYVVDSIDRVDYVTEFDALALGRDWIEDRREEFYHDLPEDKFVPIWKPEWGLENLEETAKDWGQIGIPATAFEGRNLTPLLNRLNSQGIGIHGIGITKPDEMAAIAWTSVSSTSWISPQKFGDTIVWTGKELKRYPKKTKDQARRRHRTYFESKGFDPEKIETDDHTELLRLSVWSWNRLLEDIDRKHRSDPRSVTDHADPADEQFTEEVPDGVDAVTGEIRNSPPTEVAVRKPRTRVALPILGVRTETAVDEESGESKDVSTTFLRSDSTRMCNSCFLKEKCPAFEPDQSCAYDIPVELKTKTDRARMHDSLIEMQTQRVMFMRFAEEAEGGYADPNLSGEMDRLQKMIKTKHELEQDGFSIKFEATGRSNGGDGSSGMLGRLFGSEASRRAQALPEGPRPADDEARDIVEAEVVDDGTWEHAR